MTKDQIIEDMCLTFRHDYNLILSEDDKMYSLSSGMTQRERDALRRDMKQLFEHHFESTYNNYNDFVEGRSIPIPSSIEHARAMILLAEYYLKQND